MMMILLTSHR